MHSDARAVILTASPVPGGRAAVEAVPRSENSWG